jgi:hypothetical protein
MTIASGLALEDFKTASIAIGIIPALPSNEKPMNRVEGSIVFRDIVKASRGCLLSLFILIAILA